MVIRSVLLVLLFVIFRFITMRVLLLDNGRNGCCSLYV